MFVRIFQVNEIKRWQVSCIEKLPILALEPRSPKEDSDYSVFQVDCEHKNEKTDWIILRALADNFNKRCLGMDLFLLKSELLKNLTVEKDNNNELNCLHANLKDITFEQFNLIVKYTFENSKDIISYSIKDIKILISSLSCDQFMKLVEYYISKHPDQKMDKFIKKVKNTFFKDNINLPTFLIQ